ncbi:MAG TPA: DUF488 domain-containing protein [Candidatus Hydrogenedentes bacterium]|nr:DUF488 domain-containing protein [Candidatus Hydrogenedentota bacterium]
MKLFSIGFTKRSAEDFFTRLEEAGVRRIVDVRLNNTSQIAGFAKSRELQYFLRVIAGIGYVHMPELAPTQDILDAYKKEKGSWDEYERKFRDLLKEREIADSVIQSLQDDMLEVFLLALIQESIGWRTYEVVGMTRCHRPCTRVRWESSPQALRIEYHTDYADDSQQDWAIEIVRLSDKFFAFKDQYNLGTTKIGMVLMGLTGSSGTSSEPKSYYLKDAGIHDVLTEAVSRGVVDKTLPAFLLVMKRGGAPADDAWYVDQVIGTLVPQARSASSVKIKALWDTGEVDQATAAAALALHFGKEALDAAKYHIMLETFTDADGDGGVLVKAFEKQ